MTKKIDKDKNDHNMIYYRGKNIYTHIIYIYIYKYLVLYILYTYIL